MTPTTDTLTTDSRQTAAIAVAMLAGIVAADRAAMEANDLLGLGVIGHDRYEQAAQARDEAIERAAEWLRME